MKEQLLSFGLLFGTLFFGNSAQAQCGPYMFHPFLPDTVGYAYVDLTACGGDNVLWDTGATTITTDLGVGSHTVSFYDGVTLLNTLTFDIIQEYWHFNLNIYAMAGQVQISGEVRVPSALRQIFTYVDCDDLTNDSLNVLRIIQDGTTVVDSITPYSAGIGLLVPHFYPFGYTYSVQISSPCGVAQSEETIAYGDSLTLETSNVAPTGGLSNGSISVLNVLNDPNSTLPYPGQPIGTLSLFDMNGGSPTPIGDPIEQTNNGTWNDLPAGQYMIIFTPELLCQSAIVMIDLAGPMGIDEAVDKDALVLSPVPATNYLSWNLKGSYQVAVIDAQGRRIEHGKAANGIDISTLVTGVYTLELARNATIIRQQFVKE